MVLPNSHKAPRTPCYSGADLKQVSRISRTRLSRSLAALSQGRSAIRSFCNCSKELPFPPGRSHDPPRTTPAGLASARFRLFPRFARRYSENRCCFLFLRVLRWFTSPGRLPRGYVFTARIARDYRAGFPHSDIDGSRDVCSSPSLIAAYHVLHRLHAPRHPPCALSSLPNDQPTTANFSVFPLLAPDTKKACQAVPRQNILLFDCQRASRAQSTCFLTRSRGSREEEPGNIDSERLKWR